MFIAVFTVLPQAAGSQGPVELSETELTPITGDPGDGFGHSVSIDGDTIAVGAPGDDDAASQAGAVDVFRRSGPSWPHEARLTASDAFSSQSFGWAVALAGGTAVVGTQTGLPATEAAYVFTRSGATWSQQAKLTPDDVDTQNKHFGRSLAVSGDIALIGAYIDDEASGFASSSGAVYVFRRTGSTWAQEAKITAGDPQAGAWFGKAIALDGTDATGYTAVIGAEGVDAEPPGTDPASGAAYVFGRVGSSWVQLAKLFGSGIDVDDGNGSGFGSAVAIDGNRLVVGALSSGGGSTGVWVFADSGSGWLEEAHLDSIPPLWSLALSIRDLTIGVGFPSENIPPGCSGGICSLVGSARVFRQRGGSWFEDDKLVASDGEDQDRFGAGMSTLEKTLVAGAPGDTSAGSVYVYELSLCSDGLVEATEACDDGNPVADDGCDLQCAIEHGWECSGEPSSCTEPCGNGLISISEACDDTNGAPGDGCSSSCQLEPGWACEGEPSVCNLIVCGDSLVQGSEDCDDGGTLDGDCCSSTCQFEVLLSPCADEGDPCTVDECDGAGACSHPPGNDGAACDDGVFCNGADTCSGGACTHPGDPCTAGPECASACDEVDDDCFQPSGVACTDEGNACTADQCDGAGACGHPPHPPGTTCSDEGNDCTADQCDGAGTCGHPPHPFGTTCSDEGIECTADQCDGAGVCSHPPRPAGTGCSNDGSDCTADECDGAGLCSHPALPPGTTCTDDGSECTTDECDGAGACGHPPHPSGTICSDEGNDCTADQCDGAGLCAHPALPSGSTCEDDGNECTTDECDGGGTCLHPNFDGAACDDGVFCNGADSCGSGSCSVHPGDPCLGGAACQQTCSEAAGNCLDSFGTPCPDSEVCDIDVCDGFGVCMHTPVFPGTPCDDGLFCNGENHCDTTGTCVPGRDPCFEHEIDADCSEGCDEATGSCVVFDLAGTWCDLDSDACTADTCDGSGVCTPGPVREKNRRVFDDRTRILERAEGEPEAGPELLDVDPGYDYAGDFFDYFERGFGRASIDDTCHSLDLFANFGGFFNAVWDPNWEVTAYANGLLTDDIVAHEFAHGLTQMTADLIYQHEPGALNESYSDIFGELVDLMNGDAAFAGAPGGPAWPPHSTGPGTDIPNNLRTACSGDGVRWLLGEDTSVGAVRDMWDPACFGLPTRYSEFVCNPRAVHANSSIPNHAFAMLVDGKTFNTHTVSGIGPIKAAAVWYRALTLYLTPISSFQAAVTALTQAASDLIGTPVADPRPGGSPVTFTLSDSLQVLTALQAVEMDQTTPCISFGACCDAAAVTCQNTDSLLCSGTFTPWSFCDSLVPTCGAPSGGSAMLLLLDRSEAMAVARPGGTTRCADALAAAKADVSAFAAGHPARIISVWTFQGDTSTELTSGFVGEAEALAALDSLDGLACVGTSPLAEAICAAVDELPLAASSADRVLAISTAGIEDASDGECAGPDSSAGPPPPGDYDPGSWQAAVHAKVQGEVVMLVRNWGIFDQIIPAGNGPFFSDVAGSTAGNYAPVDDADPTPPPFPTLGPVAPPVPGLSARGVAALALILAAVGGVAVAGPRSPRRRT